VFAALVRAAGSLTRRQQHAGHWRDYDIRDQLTLRESTPIGPSDQWVTAYTGLALAEASRLCGDEFRAAAERACDWLQARRNYAAGWGFNGRTGPDVDSTAHALLLLRRCGRPIAANDIRFLLWGAHRDGGFATFPNGPGRWGAPHADVTGPALLALPPEYREEHLSAAGRFLRECRGADGFWPSYWWKTPYYGTYFALCADRVLGLGIDEPPAPPWGARTVDDPCDAAFLAGIELHRRGPGPVVDSLVSRALRGRQGDGSWPGTPSLRVPRQGDPAPWSHESSPLYCDERGTLTTAHIVRVLVRIASEGRFAEDPAAQPR
jgi:hypothetical protein